MSLWYTDRFDRLGTSAIVVDKTLQAEWVTTPAHDGRSSSLFGQSHLSILLTVQFQSHSSLLYFLHVVAELTQGLGKDWTCLILSGLLYFICYLLGPCRPSKTGNYFNTCPSDLCAGSL